MHGVGDHVRELVVRGAGVHVVDVAGGEHHQVAALGCVVRRLRRARRTPPGSREPVALVLGIAVVVIVPQADDGRERARGQRRARTAIAIVDCIVCSFRSWMSIVRFVVCVHRQLLLGLGVERVLHRVTDEVEGEHGEEQGHAGEEHVPPGIAEDRRRVGDHLAPAGLVVDADAEEREGGLVEDHLRDQDRGVDDDRRGQVGQDLAEDDARVRGAGGAGGLDELLLAQRERLAADDARHVGPARDRDDEDDHADPGLDQRRRSSPHRLAASWSPGVQAAARPVASSR